MTSQSRQKSYFFGKYEILLNFNVDFKGEGVRKSKKVEGSFFVAV